MGKRYERNKKNVSENKNTLERLHTDRETLQNEYAPLSLLESIQGLLDDEATEAIQGVRAVGELESKRIESETDTAEEEKKQITSEINSEIAKLNAGLEKLRRSGSIEFGKKAVEQSSQEYKKQIDKFKSLISEMGEHVSDAGVSAGSIEGTGIAETDNIGDTPLPFNEGDTIFIPHNENDTVLGVHIQGLLPEQYKSVISSRYEMSEPRVRNVFDRFSSTLEVQDAEYSPGQTPHYSPVGYPGHPRGVYYNATEDMNNPRGQGSTYFHELGHMIDHASTGYQGNLSNSYDFANALIADGQNVLSMYSSMSPEQQSNFSNYIHQDFAHSFSDLIDATTNGQLYGSYGHSREYWQRDGNLQAEAFAHFFEASMGGGQKMELLSNLFPTSFGMFSDMIDSLQDNTMVKTLRR